jgi:hypothetical protein
MAFTATVLLHFKKGKFIGKIFGRFENQRDCLWKVFKSSRPSCEKSCINWSEGFKFADDEKLSANSAAFGAKRLRTCLIQ